MSQPNHEMFPSFELSELGRWLRSSLSDESSERQALELCREYDEAAAADLEARKALRDLPSGTNPHNLAQTGWGYVVHEDEDPQVLWKLDRLIEWRRQQAGPLFKAVRYKDEGSVSSFLWNEIGLSPGVIDVKVMPYYLLIIGGPEKVPFEIQYALSINHAVGRVCFEDPEDYRRYADAVVEAEENGVPLPRQACLFSVEKAGDATELLAKHLVEPLKTRWPGETGWQLEVCHGFQSRKQDVLAKLNGAEPPGLLMVSSHGAKSEARGAAQEAEQGALLCQRRADALDLPEDAHLLTAAELEPNAGREGELDLLGLVAFLFGCYTAGTPARDNFPQEPDVRGKALRAKPGELSDRPFVARLPQALLRRGALAVVGHVDRGWTLSFWWQHQSEGSGAVASLEDCLRQLLAGDRLGHAMRPLNRRYNALGAHLSRSLGEARERKEEEISKRLEDEIGFCYTAHHDARNFIILGDPAIYALGKPPAGAQERWQAMKEGRFVGMDEDLLKRVNEAAEKAEKSPEEWVGEVLWGRLEGGEGKL